MQYPTEVLNALQPPGMPPHRLLLKVGSPVMFTRNMNLADGVMNGTRGVVLQCRQNCLQILLTTGPGSGTVVLVPRINLVPTETTDGSLPFTRRQFPVTLAFCITINKSQGQTFDRLGLWLPTRVFSHGQLYVACSRVGDPDRLWISARSGSFLVF